MLYRQTGDRDPPDSLEPSPYSTVFRPPGLLLWLNGNESMLSLATPEIGYLPWPIIDEEC